jgi:hypothetical protein
MYLLFVNQLLLLSSTVLHFVIASGAKQSPTNKLGIASAQTARLAMTPMFVSSPMSIANVLWGSPQ